jgi:hypothetical protein
MEIQFEPRISTSASGGLNRGHSVVISIRKLRRYANQANERMTFAWRHFSGPAQKTATDEGSTKYQVVLINTGDTFVAMGTSRATFWISDLKKSSIKVFAIQIRNCIRGVLMQTNGWFLSFH